MPIVKPFRPKRRTINAAAENGDIESIMFHLLEGVDINSRNANGFFPLGGAVHFGHQQAVGYLIDHGADINMLTVLNWSPLYIAAWRRHLDVAKILLKAGANTKGRTLHCDYGPSQAGFTALHAAALNGDSKMARLLLKYGADPRKRAAGRLPEDVARNEGHIAVARILGANRRACS